MDMAGHTLTLKLLVDNLDSPLKVCNGIVCKLTGCVPIKYKPIRGTCFNSLLMCTGLSHRCFVLKTGENKVCSHSIPANIHDSSGLLWLRRQTH